MEQPILEQVQNLEGFSSTELLVTLVIGLTVLGLIAKYFVRGAMAALLIASAMWVFDVPEGARDLVGRYRDMAAATIEPVVDRFLTEEQGEKLKNISTSLTEGLTESVTGENLDNRLSDLERIADGTSTLEDRIRGLTEADKGPDGFPWGEPLDG